MPQTMEFKMPGSPSPPIRPLQENDNGSPVKKTLEERWLGDKDRNSSGSSGGTDQIAGSVPPPSSPGSPPAVTVTSSQSSVSSTQVSSQQATQPSSGSSQQAYSPTLPPPSTSTAPPADSTPPQKAISSVTLTSGEQVTSGVWNSLTRDQQKLLYRLGIKGFLAKMEEEKADYEKYQAAVEAGGNEHGLPPGITQDDVSSMQQKLADIQSAMAQLSASGQLNSGTDANAQFQLLLNQRDAIQSQLDYIDKYTHHYLDYDFGSGKGLTQEDIQKALDAFNLSDLKYITAGNSPGSISFDFLRAVKDGVSSDDLKKLGYTQTQIDAASAYNQYQSSGNSLLSALSSGMTVSQLSSLGLTHSDGTPYTPQELTNLQTAIQLGFINSDGSLNTDKIASQGYNVATINALLGTTLKDSSGNILPASGVFGAPVVPASGMTLTSLVAKAGITPITGSDGSQSISSQQIVDALLSGKITYNDLVSAGLFASSGKPLTDFGAAIQKNFQQQELPKVYTNQLSNLGMSGVGGYDIGTLSSLINQGKFSLKGAQTLFGQNLQNILQINPVTGQTRPMYSMSALMQAFPNSASVKPYERGAYTMQGTPLAAAMGLSGLGSMASQLLAAKGGIGSLGGGNPNPFQLPSQFTAANGYTLGPSGALQGFFASGPMSNPLVPTATSLSKILRNEDGTYTATYRDGTTKQFDTFEAAQASGAPKLNGFQSFLVNNPLIKFLFGNQVYKSPNQMLSEPEFQLALGSLIFSKYVSPLRFTIGAEKGTVTGSAWNINTDWLTSKGYGWMRPLSNTNAIGIYPGVGFYEAPYKALGDLPSYGVDWSTGIFGEVSRPPFIGPIIPKYTFNAITGVYEEVPNVLSALKPNFNYVGNQLFAYTREPAGLLTNLKYALNQPEYLGMGPNAGIGFGGFVNKSIPTWSQPTKIGIGDVFSSIKKVGVGKTFDLLGWSPLDITPSASIRDVVSAARVNVPFISSSVTSIGDLGIGPGSVIPIQSVARSTVNVGGIFQGLSRVVYSPAFGNLGLASMAIPVIGLGLSSAIPVSINAQKDASDYAAYAMLQNQLISQFQYNQIITGVQSAVTPSEISLVVNETLNPTSLSNLGKVTSQTASTTNVNESVRTFNNLVNNYLQNLATSTTQTNISNFNPNVIVNQNINQIQQQTQQTMQTLPGETTNKSPEGGGGGGGGGGIVPPKFGFGSAPLTSGGGGFAMPPLRGGLGSWVVRGLKVYAPSPIENKVVGGTFGKKTVAYGSIEPKKKKMGIVGSRVSGSVAHVPRQYKGTKG